MATTDFLETATVKQIEIVQKFLVALDLHMNSLRLGEVNDKHTVQDFAKILHVLPYTLQMLSKKLLTELPAAFTKKN